MKKHILCLGDSNTHGYCADPDDCADGGKRFNEDERWTCLLQKALGDEYLVIEEGLGGRTTVFQDPLHEGMDTLSVLYPILKSHQDIDLLIVMLGTNDTKDRFAVNAYCISLGMERLLLKAISIDCWSESGPNILVVAPAPIGREMVDDGMGIHCAEKSEELAKYYEPLAKSLGCHFLDAHDCEVNPIDYTHLSKKGHSQLAKMLADVVPEIIQHTK